MVVRRPIGPMDTSQDNPGADTQTWNAYQNYSSYYGTPTSGYGYVGFAPQYRAGQTAARAASTPSYSSSGGGGGGGYGYGGGGGGGGRSALTQQMFDAMMKALAAGGQPLAYTPVDLPDFQGQALPAFNAAPYTQAMGQINTAVTADKAASAAAAAQAQKALQANYTNAYATAQGQAAPEAQQVGTGLQGTAGGGGDQAAVAAQSDAAAQSDQASFANLLNVLAAADTQAQSSRMNQVALDQATAGRSINAQALGLRGGVTSAQTRAQEQWRQAAAEREYQNSLMAQQWQREEQIRNQDLANQTTQANWTQSNEMINNRLTPLLELLAQTNPNIDMSALTKLISGWGS